MSNGRKISTQEAKAYFLVKMSLRNVEGRLLEKGDIPLFEDFKEVLEIEGLQQVVDDSIKRQYQERDKRRAVLLDMKRRADELDENIKTLKEKNTENEQLRNEAEDAKRALQTEVKRVKQKLDATKGETAAWVVRSIMVTAFGILGAAAVHAIWKDDIQTFRELSFAYVGAAMAIVSQYVTGKRLEERRSSDIDYE